MPGETTVIWNLVQYLISRYQLTSNSAPYVLLVLGGALLCMLVPYLLGSVNPAVLISRLVYHEDVRERGSGNAGTTNMLRSYGKKAAAITLICDILKAVIAYWFGFFLFLGYTGGAIAGFFVVFGHMFPVFAKFRGGKGVACLAAVALCTNPPAFAILLVLWLLIVLGTRYVSLASVMVAFLYPLLLRAFGMDQIGLVIAMAIVSSVFVIIRHKDNLKRLYNGKESKINLFKKDK